MGGRALLVVAGLGAVVACSAFGEMSAEAPDDAGTPTASDSGTEAAAPPGDASDARADASPTCDWGCVVFDDTFDRAPSDVQGFWSNVEGVLALFTEEPRGNVLRATMTPGIAAGAGRPATLAKNIGPAGSVRVNADVRVSSTGTFASGGAEDYCELISVSVDRVRIALAFMDANGLGVWQVDGNDTFFKNPPVLLENWAMIELTMETVPSLAVTLRVGSETIKAGTSASGKGPSGVRTVRAGLHCVGDTPQIDAFIDNVVVRANP